LPEVKGEAPSFFGARDVDPQLVTPTITLLCGKEPFVSPVSTAGNPKFSTHGPPLEPPFSFEPMMWLFEFEELV
jgi:hypothetical protein